MRGRGMAGSGYTKLLVLVGLLALTAVTIVIAYQRERTALLNIGDPGDTPFLTPFTFNGDEADLNYRYRWTTGHSELEFIGAGSARPQSVSIRAQRPPPSFSAVPVTISVSLNGQLLQPAVITLSEGIKLYSFQVEPGGAALSAPYRVVIDATTFQSGGDTRTLGVKVDSVTLQQEGGGVNWPPIWAVGWWLVVVAGLYALVLSLPGRGGVAPGFLVSVAAIAALVFLHSVNALYLAAYLPAVAAVIGLVGLLAWQRERLWRWPEAVDNLNRARLSGAIMLVAMLVYAGLSLWTIPQVAAIGHADYAENAVIARNVVEGRGFVVDYVAQFYKDYPGITHPAETWPLLQPLLITPFFMVFGPQTWAAKLPNLVIMLGLAWAIYALSSRLFDRRVGLLAGVLALTHPYFFNAVLYPINDLPFTALFFAFVWLLSRSVLHNSTLTLALTGVVAGLLIWSKPSGAALIAGVVLWLLWRWLRQWPGRRTKAESALPWRWLFVAGGAALIVLLPLVIRNLLDFKVPFFSTESLDVAILRYWPRHDAEDIYKVYAGGELPALRWIIGGKFGYENLFNAIIDNVKAVWLQGVLGEPGTGEYVFGLLPLCGALVGLAALPQRARGLLGMVGVGLGVYTLFVLLYWHYEGRYFQVVVPWLYMLLGWAVFWVWDRIRQGWPGREGRGWGLLVLPVAVVGLLSPSVRAIVEEAQGDIVTPGFVTGMQWLKANSSPQDVVMTRDPWELNWQTERKAVMIPNEDLQTIERIAKQYGVTMLQLGGPGDGINVRNCPADASAGSFPTGSRPALGALYCGVERPGYKLVYRQGALTVYRLGN
ncbi:MAG: glycosyltransferase family 39 protein [Chloroflexi bacterium]|nr:glycosyltransferase family 39 protein [Chloroflexota bacterium]